jgi:exopolysaccharide production protein ExoQ
MHKPSGEPRSTNRYAGAMKRFNRPTVRKVAGGGSLVLMGILFWLIVYQNLPTSLNTMRFKPFDTAGTIDRIVKLGTILIGFIIIAARWSVSRHLARHANPGLWIFIGFAGISFVWSIDAAATQLRMATLMGIVLLCVAISLVGWNRGRFQYMAVPPLMFILVVSLVIGALYPGEVLELGGSISLDNAWHGITYQKNQFGMTASMATVILASRAIAKGGGGFWTFAGIGISVTCLLLSRSSASLLATMLCVMFCVMVMRVPIIRQRFSTHVTVGIGATILIYEMVILDLIPGGNMLLKPVMALTGKDMTFSARTVIWDILKMHMQAWPWLGSGYAAYWPTLPTPASPSYIFEYLMHFYPGEAHNGYLETQNGLGRVGLLCLFAYIAWYIRQALQLMRYDRGQAVMYLVVLYQQMVANLSESEWFSRSTICMVLLLATMCLSRDLLEYRTQSRTAGRNGGQRGVPAPEPPRQPVRAASRFPIRGPRI